MKISTKIHLSEHDVREIIAHYFKLEVKEMDILVQHKDDIPQGATPGDCIGITLTI